MQSEPIPVHRIVCFVALVTSSDWILAVVSDAGLETLGAYADARDRGVGAASATVASDADSRAAIEAATVELRALTRSVTGFEAVLIWRLWARRSPGRRGYGLVG